MACLSQALRLGGLLPPHNAFQDTFLTMRDGPHRSCPRAQRVPVHPQVFPHSYLPLSRHSQRMQQPQGDDRAGPEVGLRVCGDGAQLLIDFIEQGGDKLYSDHTALLSWDGCHADHRGRVVGRLQAQKHTLGVRIVLYLLSGL